MTTLSSAAPVTRLAGATRIETSVAISEASFSPGVPVAYVATSENFPDALSGAPAAAMAGGPVLLTPPSGLPAVVGTELARLKPGRIVVLGGTGVVPTAVLRSLEAYTTGTVTRLAGKTRIGTSVAISRASFSPGVPAVYVATSENFPDALSGAPVAGMTGGPVLLTPPSGLPSVVATELARLRPGRIVVLGGSDVVPTAILRSLKAYTTGTVTRLAGVTRIGTSVVISRAAFSPGVPVVYLATSLAFPDALSGAAVAGVTGAPLLLTKPGSLPRVVGGELARLRPGRIVILGGTGAVSTATTAAASVYVRGSLSGTVTDVASHHGLAGARVEVYSQSKDTFTDVVTDADGRYRADGLLAVSDYQVCFDAHDATGGSGDAYGYLSECYDGAPGLDTLSGDDHLVPGATLVAVRPGSPTTRIDVSVRAGAAISGTVTEAGGAHHPLAGVTVDAYSRSSGMGSSAQTAADGTYRVTRLPLAGDIIVTFRGADATGGASDALGYLYTCFSGPACAAVPVASGVTTSGIDVALKAGGGISGTVRSTASGHPPIGDVWVWAESASLDLGGSATTGADGTYLIRGLPAASDYVVTFEPESGFKIETYDNVVPFVGTPTNVPVTSGVLTSGIDAYLAPY